MRKTPMSAKTKASLNSIRICSGTTTSICGPNFAFNVSIKKEFKAPPPVTNRCFLELFEFNLTCCEIFSQIWCMEVWRRFSTESFVSSTMGTTSSNKPFVANGFWMG